MYSVCLHVHCTLRCAVIRAETKEIFPVQSFVSNLIIILVNFAKLA